MFLSKRRVSVVAFVVCILAQASASTAAPRAARESKPGTLAPKHQITYVVYEPWQKMPVKIWIERGDKVKGFRPNYNKLLMDAFMTWAQATNGALQIVRASSKDKANIVCSWCSLKELRNYTTDPTAIGCAVSPPTHNLEYVSTLHICPDIQPSRSPQSRDIVRRIDGSVKAELMPLEDGQERSNNRSIVEPMAPRVRNIATTSGVGTEVNYHTTSYYVWNKTPDVTAPAPVRSQDSAVAVTESQVDANIQPGESPVQTILNEDIKVICLHEAGHALGLGHSKVKADIMYPGTTSKILSDRDRFAITRLYPKANQNE